MLHVVLLYTFRRRRRVTPYFLCRTFPALASTWIQPSEPSADTFAVQKIGYIENTVSLSCAYRHRYTCRLPIHTNGPLFPTRRSASLWLRSIRRSSLFRCLRSFAAST